MKKLTVFLFLALSAIGLCAQDVTISDLKRIFNDRFISTQEARQVFPDFPQNLPIPFSLEELEENFFFWLVPVRINGIAQYILLHTSFPMDSLMRNKNEMSRSDTLSLSNAKNILTLLHRLRPQFPASKDYKPEHKFQYVYRTKDSGPAKWGMDFRKTLIYDLYQDHLCAIVNLPKTLEFCTLNSKYIYYMISGSLGFEFLKQEISKKEKNILIYTLIYLTEGRR